MEIFFILVLGIEIIATLILQIITLKKIEILEQDISSRENNFDNLIGKINELDRRLMAKLNFDATKPMKTNNWDSVRNCFKGPARVDVNERD